MQPLRLPASGDNNNLKPRATARVAPTISITMKTFFALFLFLALGVFAQAQSNGSIITQDVATFKKTLQSKKVQLVDVRTPAEYTAGNIEGSQNIDVKSDQFKEMAGKLDKKRPVAVYCKAGVRSANAANILKEMGFKKIYNLDGGYTAWTK